MNGDAKKLIKQSRMPTLWCAGCGLHVLFPTIAGAMVELGWDETNTAVVSGIGCTGRIAGYFDLDSVHTTHGRAIPAAEGMALANPDLNVVVASGDGDLTSIGGNHLLHAARRNTSMTVIMDLNEVYGMTGGQAAPTTQKGRVTQTTPSGSVISPLNVQNILSGNNGFFYARTTTAHIKHLQAALKAAFEWRGFSFVEVISFCSERFGKMNKVRNPAEFNKMLLMEYKIRETADKPLGDKELGIYKK